MTFWCLIIKTYFVQYCYSSFRGAFSIPVISPLGCKPPPVYKPSLNQMCQPRAYKRQFTVIFHGSSKSPQSEILTLGFGLVTVCVINLTNKRGLGFHNQSSLVHPLLVIAWYKACSLGLLKSGGTGRSSQTQILLFFSRCVTISGCRV